MRRSSPGSWWKKGGRDAAPPFVPTPHLLNAGPGRGLRPGPALPGCTSRPQQGGPLEGRRRPFWSSCTALVKAHPRHRLHSTSTGSRQRPPGLARSPRASERELSSEEKWHSGRLSPPCPRKPESDLSDVKIRHSASRVGEPIPEETLGVRGPGLVAPAWQAAPVSLIHQLGSWELYCGYPSPWQSVVP